MLDIVWHGEDVIRIVQGMGSTAWAASGVSIDTRTLRPGDLYIALKGAHHDGAQFVQEAFQKGAVAVLMEHSTQIKCSHSLDPLPIIYVSDGLHALQTLSIVARERFSGRILALTGSVGKTNVKEGLRMVLSAQNPTFATLGNLNNHIGVPLSLVNISSSDIYAVLELGMNHAGEITQLAQWVQPHIAMLLNVSYQHGAFFPNEDAIVQAKCEIFDDSRVGIAPRDSQHYDKFPSHKAQQWITFGHHPDSHVRCLSVNRKDNGMQVEISIDGQRWFYDLAQFGSRWVDNSLAILAGVLALGADVKQASQDLIKLQPVCGRGSILDIAGITVIDESYNAAPAAMCAAIEDFATHPSSDKKSGKKYLCLGEMGELGHLGPYYHQKIVTLLDRLSANFDGVWLCGSLWSSTSPHSFFMVESIQEAIPDIITYLKAGDSILVKGARYTKTFLLIDALYHAYNMEEQRIAYPLRRYFACN